MGHLMGPEDYTPPTLGEVDTDGAADPDFGVNTGSPGVSTSSWDRHGAICAKCGVGHCEHGVGSGS